MSLGKTIQWSVIFLFMYFLLVIFKGADNGELPTIYQNPGGVCIGSKPTGLCYSKSLGEHTVIIIE
jgi:hypothetical protein